MSNMRAAIRVHKSAHAGRIIAKCESKTRIFHYDHALSHEGNHIEAANVMAVSLGVGDLLGGQLPDGSYCFIWREKL